ncbi:MAG: hypothetical protein Q7S33_00530 [Nanoarchaeota archaeon]|nr:hypothetical protein [Nanoarchaeota archaeon]
MRKAEDIALFDMDGTLFDYNLALFNSLEKLRSPNEQPYTEPIRDNAPDYIKERANIIRSSEEWWENLPKLKSGWDILELTKKYDFRTVILTQGPRKNPASWSGKKKCIDKNFGEDTDIIITRDKSLVYGKILVDDYPDYVQAWLNHRPRGLVIMPTNNENTSFSYPNVIHYDGPNLNEVEKAIRFAKER